MDINSNHGCAAENSAFMVTHGLMYGLSLPTAIWLYHNTKIHSPCSDLPALPVPAPAPIPILAPQAITLTTLQLQWLQEDLRVATPISPMLEKLCSHHNGVPVTMAIWIVL